MSIERNKADFEEALAQLEAVSKDLEGILADDIVNTIKSVIDEYNVHFSDDIEELINNQLTS